MSNLREYAIAAYFRIFLSHISRLHGPHILKKMSAFFLHAYIMCLFNARHADRDAQNTERMLISNYDTHFTVYVLLSRTGSTGVYSVICSADEYSRRGVQLSCTDISAHTYPRTMCGYIRAEISVQNYRSVRHVRKTRICNCRIFGTSLHFSHILAKCAYRIFWHFRRH